jgi:hypothetical protein
MTPETIERARRQCCNVAAVQTFFDRFSPALTRAPQLILNCDETHISSRKRFKVLSPQGVLPLKVGREKLPHFSAMCTISASGHKFAPMLILPDQARLPDDLSELPEEAFFVSTGTGWMTQRAFLFFAHFFLYELEHYRATLPVELRGERCLLVLDGHSSRWTYEAVSVLNQAGVDILVLPAHCTHVLQPFDVAIASPLKTAMSRYDDDQDITLSLDAVQQLQITREEPQWLQEKRKRLIFTFLDAWSTAACRHNILSGFRATGLCPVDREKRLSAPDTRHLTAGEIYEPPRRGASDMNCTMVTERDNLMVLFLKPNNVFREIMEKVSNQDEQWIELLTRPTVSGRFLAGPDAFTWGRQEGRSTQLTEDCPRKHFAYQMVEPPPKAVWYILGKVALAIPKVIACPNWEISGSFSRYLTRIGVGHAFFNRQTTREGRIQAWHDFQTGAKDVSVTSLYALLCLVSARRILVVYLEVPNPRSANLIIRDHTLIFFGNAGELAGWRLKRVLPHIRLIPPIRQDTQPLA